MAKTTPIPAPKPFPVQIIIRLDDLTSAETTQNCRAMAIYPDGLGYSGTAVVLRLGDELRITFKGNLHGMMRREEL